MTTSPAPPVSSALAARIREVRHKRGLSVAALAERCKEQGAGALTEHALYTLETRRSEPDRTPRKISVDELFAIALALNCPPLYLLVPPDGPDEEYQLTATVTESRANVCRWFTGEGPILPRFPLVGDVRQFYSEIPEEKFYEIQEKGQVIR